ncbi:PRD domain-containing protein [Biomaibacter acetigenes]|uniref:PRD domain-containing protein n=1 Tax=Biomaibacter acetigenes TaxID=2316383 RepID=A0A3G2R7V9_9FIRM|nr:PRD domain-containing protein [Biomaibacter acetigenes]AYO31540.1 PRD domain-containing protein [Biomaibacter acetigenes]RKL62138.1 PRD domain-containing protein [Thermoanaerobacteraceae bacterium SP2]
MRNFILKKILNNNVVMAQDVKSGEEAVLVGRGLGFEAKPGKEVDEEKIEKIFYFFDEAQYKQYKNILDSVDRQIIGLTEEILAMVAKQLDEPLNEHIHVALADHINFTLERLAGNLEIENPFLEEIRALYPQDYELACKAADMIEQKFNVKIPDGEKGFIAMHLHSARANRELSRTVKYTSMINRMVEIIEEELGLKLDRDEINFARLLVHLRFALERVDRDIPIKNPLQARIKKEFGQSYKVAEKIAGFIRERMGKNPPQDELGYLALHIQRIRVSS